MMIQNIFKLETFSSIGLVLMLALTACAPGPLNTGATKNQPFTEQSHVQKTPAYTGPVSMRFDNALLSPSLASYGFKKTVPHKTQVFEQPSEQTFSIQALPNGPVVFSETFTKGRQEFEVLREIRVSDTQKRYTLHVQKWGDPRSDAQVVVNINGTNWVKEGDFKGQSQEFQQESLLLNAQNSLRVRLKGKQGSAVRITLVEGGQADTVLRRRGALRKPGETQATHVRRNDTNIFDPNDPTSLGGLVPYSQIPKSADGRSLPTFALNGGVPATYSGGEFQLKIKAPVQANLNALLQKYKGYVTGEISADEFLVKLDLSQANLNALPAHIQQLNQLVDGSLAIQDLAFDSLEGAQMFALMVELLLEVRQGNQLQSMDINPILNSNVPSSSEGFAANGQSADAEDSWWLTQTGVLKAWDYTLGYDRQTNKPVRVAVVDSDFQNLNQAMSAQGDLDSQVLYTRAAKVHFNAFPENQSQAGYRIAFSQTPNPSEHYLEPDFFVGQGKTDHGTSQASTIASRINNRKGIVGVAPHAKIIPIKIGSTFSKKETPDPAEFNAFEIVTGWDLRLAVEAAGRLRADIVSITHSMVGNGPENWLQNVQQFTTDMPFGWLGALQYQIDLAAQPRNNSTSSNRLISVFNAGNAGNHVRTTLPAGKLKNIVIAGALMQNSASFKRALYVSPEAVAERFLFSTTDPIGAFIKNIDSDETKASCWWIGNSNSPNSDIQQYESTYGNQVVKVWAPGDKMFALGTFRNSSQGFEYGVSPDWGGTSAATPFTAGALALLKSLKPDLSIQDLKTGNWLRYKTIQISDSLLKDFVINGTNRKGLRLPPQSLSLNVLDLESTIAGNPALHQGRLLEIGTGTLRKHSNGRPYLETSAGNYDLSMYLEQTTFDGDSTSSIDPAIFQQASLLLHQESYAAFWNTYGLNLGGQFAPFSDFENKNVEVTGWSYQPSDEPEKNIEVLSIKESNSSGGGTGGGFQIKSEVPSAAELPQNNYLYDQVGNRWMRPGFRIQVDANEFAGIRFSQPIRDLEVKIGPVLVPITSILNDLAVMGIPDNLPAGVHDVVIKASGQTLTLEQAVEKVSQAIPPTPEPTAPPSGNPGEYESVRVFNIEGNDEGRVYLNDQLILTAHAGEDNYAYLGEYGSYPLLKDQRNEFRFELVNNGGGYTYGFELRAQYNGTAAYRDIQGSPGLQNKVLPDGSEDQRQGVVYNERMITNSKFSPVGTGPFWMKVFNLNPDESLTIQTYNDTNDIQWPDGVFRVGPPINSQEISKQLPIQPFDPFSSCGIYDPNFECWNPRYIGFYLENPTGPYNVGIEVYKGINLVYRNIQGQRGVWGAEENQEGSSNPYIQDYTAHQYRHYPAGY
ncbi:MAG: S8 family serine peptidase [Candidatus Sericytochromatia bacterium]|nr:S8 family serine peptidase [Candidatus Sericytochromatia bacterium]